MTDLLAKIPTLPGETITAMSHAPLKTLGENALILCTSQQRIFVVRVEEGGDVTIAGPLEFWRPD